MLTTLLAAAVDPLLNNPIPDGQATKLFGLNLRDIFLVTGVAMVLGLLLFLGAYLTHRGRRHRSNHRSSKPLSAAQKPSPAQIHPSLSFMLMIHGCTFACKRRPSSALIPFRRSWNGVDSTTPINNAENRPSFLSRSATIRSTVSTS